MNKLFLVHNGKAYYPELQAYRCYYEDRFEVCELSPQEAESVQAKPGDVAWYLMGFFRKSINKALIIHDFRSLSVGRFMLLKDFIKKMLIPSPDVRVFLNEKVEAGMAFSPGVPSFHIDMGVPQYFFDSSEDSSTYACQYDYAYVGNVGRDRDAHIMLDQFWRAYKHRHSLVLIGDFDFELRDRWECNTILFLGRLDQKQVFDVLRHSKICISYIPDREPYNQQTSTKLLEYAAMSKPVFANNSASNRLTIEKYGLNRVCIQEGFPADPMTLLPVAIADRDSLTWPAKIRQSGIDNLLNGYINQQKF